MTPNISVDIDRGEITIGPMHMRRLFNTRGGHTAIEVRVGDERVLCGTVHMRTDEWAEVWGTAIMAAGISDVSANNPERGR